ncbi:MAG: winged helix-turn-helix transcriptional regulator [Candidatus Brockarchaeota archaeon]|nr:winged helix-turn-helix transcriptional regulator [Candidatus Brockarchaeota archaeon]
MARERAGWNERILIELEKNGNMSFGELMEKLNVKKNLLIVYLTRLRKEGLVNYDRSVKKSWSISGKGKKFLEYKRYVEEHESTKSDVQESNDVVDVRSAVVYNSIDSIDNNSNINNNINNNNNKNVIHSSSNYIPINNTNEKYKKENNEIVQKTEENPYLNNNNNKISDPNTPYPHSNHLSLSHSENNDTVIPSVILPFKGSKELKKDIFHLLEELYKLAKSKIDPSLDEKDLKDFTSMHSYSNPNSIALRIKILKQLGAITPFEYSEDVWENNIKREVWKRAYSIVPLRIEQLLGIRKEPIDSYVEEYLKKQDELDEQQQLEKQQQIKQAEKEVDEYFEKAHEFSKEKESNNQQNPTSL